MKKVLAIVLALTLVFALAACGSAETATADPTAAPAEETAEAEATAEATEETANEVITVGASSTPHAEILEQIKPLLAEEGYDLEIVIFDDYVLPNTALEDGELDANYFQHTPYLDSFNESNGTHLVAAASIHYEPFGLWGNGLASLDDVAEGATILIPADDSNETRALLLLAQEGLITLPEDASAANGVSHLDIVEDNGYNIVPVQADMVPSQYLNSDAGTLAVVNGNYALAAGLDIADALAIEDASGDAA